MYNYTKKNNVKDTQISLYVRRTDRFKSNKSCYKTSRNS